MFGDNPMKTLIFCLTPILISLSLFGQDYVPIPSDSTSEWRAWNGNNDGMCICNYEIRYFFNGDTTIGPETYHKLYYSGLYYEEDFAPPTLGCDAEWPFENIYRGGIRNSDGKVYHIFDGGPEILIYDYTLAVGDTLNTGISGNNMTIESIDSVLIGNDYRLRFNLHDPDGYCNWIIEGIGHERGLIEPMYIPLEFASELYCYAENHIPVFPEGSDCDLTVKVPEVETMNVIMNLYPNPTSGYINISVRSNIESTINFRIISSTGKIILECPWNINPGINEKSIDLSSIRSGIFIAVVEDGNNIMFKKFTLTK